MIYGYTRVSTPRQKIERQIANIKAYCENAVIIEERYTGRTIERPQFMALCKQLAPGDTVVFDEVSRMSRNAEEGFELYQELYEKGISLIFLKQRHLDTSTFKETLDNSVQLTGTEVDIILEAVNRYLLALAKKQIEIAFEEAEHEVELLSKRTSEGVRRAQINGKRVGTRKGDILEPKKKQPVKALIKKYHKDFGGTKNSIETMEQLARCSIKVVRVNPTTGDPEKLLQSARVSKDTFYKYLKELKKEEAEQLKE